MYTSLLSLQSLASVRHKLFLNLWSYFHYFSLDSCVYTHQPCLELLSQTASEVQTLFQELPYSLSLYFGVRTIEFPSNSLYKNVCVIRVYGTMILLHSDSVKLWENDERLFL